MPKITTTFIDPVSTNGPILGRRYTLTHSDETGELFLTISPNYDLSSSPDRLRDGVYGEWVDGSEDLLGLFVQVGGTSYEDAKQRYSTFVNYLPLSIAAILYGDQKFFNNYPELLEAPILIKFDSGYPEFNKVVNYGKLKDYYIPS